MKKTQWTAVAAALLIGATSLSALAQPDHRGPQGGGPGQRPAQAGPQYKHPAPPPPPMARPGVQPQHPGQPQGMRPGQPPRMGVGPQHNWVQGSRVPPQYRSNHYVVNDWRGHGLNRPPRGQQWVQYGGDYLLVAIATGVITQLIMGR